MTTTIKEALIRVQESGRKAAQHERTTEIIEAICSVGLHVRQGDIILTMTDEVPSGTPSSQKQLAPGTTQGSRHIAEGEIEVYPSTGNDPLEGPLLRVTGPENLINHPEHRHYRLPTGTCWRVTYERDLGQEERARMLD